MQLHVGIDCGVSGGLAILDHDGSLLAVEDMPIMATGKKGNRRQVNAAALEKLLRGWLVNYGQLTVAIEELHPMPKNGSIASFALGRSYGAVEGVLVGLSLSARYVQPQVWKKHYALTSDKERSRTLAQQLYPTADLSRKKDHGRAESLLIARWAWSKPY